MTPREVSPAEVHCRGGWCVLRESCAHYNPGRVHTVTVDRLCARGASEQHKRRSFTFDAAPTARMEKALQTNPPPPLNIPGCAGVSA